MFHFFRLLGCDLTKMENNPALPSEPLIEVEDISPANQILLEVHLEVHVFKAFLNQRPRTFDKTLTVGKNLEIFLSDSNVEERFWRKIYFKDSHGIVLQTSANAHIPTPDSFNIM